MITPTLLNLGIINNTWTNYVLWWQR